MLERTFTAIQKMHEKHIEPDSTIYNVILSACGRAGEICRLGDIYRQMRSKKNSPNVVTYGTLADVLVKNDRPSEAMEIYERALLEKNSNSIRLFGAVAESCATLCTHGAHKSHEVWEQLHVNNLSPDVKFIETHLRVFGSLSDIKNVILTFEDIYSIGLKPTYKLYSLLLQACVKDGQCEKAFRILFVLAKTYPNGLHSSRLTYGWNCLVNHYAVDGSFLRVCEVLEEGIRLGLKPNKVTLSGLINLCLVSKESELAVDLFLALEQLNIKLDEPLVKGFLKVSQQHCQLIRAGIKTETIIRARHPGKLILRILGLQDTSSFMKANWTDFTLKMYRKALYFGVQPTISLLNLVVSCLRKPVPIMSRFRDTSSDEYWIQKAIATKEPSTFNSSGNSIHPLSQSKYSEEFPPVLAALEYDAEGSWDPKVFQIIEQGIKLGLLPPFHVSNCVAQNIDLRHLPPQISETYVMYVLESLRRYLLVGQQKLDTTFLLLIHPFNPSAVLTVSGRVTPVPTKVLQPLSEEERGAAQGLGVIAMLRRVRLRYVVFPEEGQVAIEPEAAQSWAFTVMRKATCMKGFSPNSET